MREWSFYEILIQKCLVHLKGYFMWIFKKEITMISKSDLLCVLFFFFLRNQEWAIHVSLMKKKPSHVLGTPHSRVLSVSPWLSLSCSVVSDPATPRTATRQASLSFTFSQRLPKFMCIELVKLPNRLIHCHPLLLLPSICPSIRVFSNESVL